MPKRPHRQKQKPTKMSSSCKAKQCVAGLEANVVNCGVSACRHTGVSGAGMGISKGRAPQYKSESHLFKVHKLAQSHTSTFTTGLLFSIYDLLKAA